MKKDDQQINPYSSPEEYDKPPREFVDAELVPGPCPRCGSTNARPAPYDGIYGRRSPVAIKHVVCPKCRCEYDGITGLEYSPRKNPAIWIFLAVLGFIAYIVFVVMTGAF
ncbi:MAG: hypothetical protein IH991_07125 [Planctomycetes bacterium]|nr:hypothetical protein [Planctomycetota bacterium]